MHRLPLQEKLQGVPAMTSTTCVCHHQPALGQAIAEALAAVQFGTVELVIHEGRVVQLERHEKIRLDRSVQRSTQTTE